LEAVNTLREYRGKRTQIATHRAPRISIVILVESPSRILSGLEQQIRNVDIPRRDLREEKSKIVSRNRLSD